MTPSPYTAQRLRVFGLFVGMVVVLAFGTAAYFSVLKEPDPMDRSFQRVPGPGSSFITRDVGYHPRLDPFLRLRLDSSDEDYLNYLMGSELEIYRAPEPVPPPASTASTDDGPIFGTVTIVIAPGPDHIVLGNPRLRLRHDRKSWRWLAGGGIHDENTVPEK